MLCSARAREDRQIHVEFEGSRILSSSGTAHSSQTDSDYNKQFQLQLKLYDVCGGGKKGGEKQRARGRGTFVRKHTR